MNNEMSKAKRETEYDLLRVVSLLGVIVIHVSAMQWRTLAPESGEWAVLHVYDMLSKFSVPVFFMISGRFMLDPGRQYPVRKMLQKALHIAIVFVFWSAIYTVLNMGRVLWTGDSLRNHIWVLVEFFTGEYHMWFLFTIAGLYLLTPLLRHIAASREMCRYFLALFLVFGSLMPFLEKMPLCGAILAAMNDKVLLDMAVGYSGCYVLGHWLRTENLSRKAEKWLYLGGVLGAFVTVGATWLGSLAAGTADETLAEYLSPNVLLASAAVYRFVISRRDQLKPSRLLSWLSAVSFGCYLVHPLILWIFEWIGLMPTLLHPVVMVPILTGITLLISAVITVAMKKVPVLRSVVS